LASNSKKFFKYQSSFLKLILAIKFDVQMSQFLANFYKKLYGLFFVAERVVHSL